MITEDDFEKFIPHIKWQKYIYDKINTGINTQILANDGTPILNTPFNELVTAQKTTLIELKSVYTLSKLRDNITTLNTASVTHTGREYLLDTNNENDYAKLSSVQRGRYVSGKAAEYGIGVRTSTDTFVENINARWGAINDTVGFYFGKDNTGNYVAILDDSIETKIYQNDWNNNKLDGTDTHGLILDTSVGNVYNIEFTWYGYGVINFIVFIKTTEGLKRYIVHTHIVNSQTSISNPNLNITADIEHLDSNISNYSIYVAGRQFSILGEYKPSFRTTSEYVIDKAILNNTMTPVISFKHKTNFEHFNVKFKGYDIITLDDIIVELYINTQLTNPVWNTPTRVNAQETALEVDVSATAIDTNNAILLFRSIILGGLNKNQKNTDDLSLSDFAIDIPDGSICSLVIFGINTNTTVTALLDIKEEW